MDKTTAKLLNMFVYQNRIFVFSPRELSAANALAQLELFRLEEGECVGVKGHWLEMTRKISVTL